MYSTRVSIHNPTGRIHYSYHRSYIMSCHTFQVFKGSSQGKIVQSETRRTLADDEVLVRITHAGLCGTDLHFKNEDMVLGHEGVGVVQEVGSAVTSFRPCVCSVAIFTSDERLDMPQGRPCRLGVPSRVVPPVQ